MPTVTIDVHRRLAWLRRDPDGYLPQPYEQLAAVYRRTGHDWEARRVGPTSSSTCGSAMPLAAFGETSQGGYHVWPRRAGSPQGPGVFAICPVDKECRI
jgi:hypothetical protein